jgi:predicted methyltransferase
MSIRPRTLLLALAVVGIAYVGEEVVRTLNVLNAVERERDGWQRPDAILASLDLRPGQTVVDFGSGAGYFALKMAAAVQPGGRIVAIDLRRESLAFLWLRARLRGLWNVQTVVSTEHDPRLSASALDRALIANTYHELADPDPILAALHSALRPGGRLVIVDRRSRTPAQGAEGSSGHHDIEPDTVLQQVVAHGFRLLQEDDALVDRSTDDEIWWLIVVERL